MSLPYLPVDIRVKTLKTRTTLESMTNSEIRRHLGLPLANVLELFEVLEPFVEKSTERGRAIRSETQLISALSFFKSGSFQYVEGTVGRISQSSVCSAIQNVSRGITTHLAKEYISFPKDLP